MADTITKDLTSLVNDISQTIRPLEMCRLFYGEADQQTLGLIKKIIATRYPSLCKFESSDQILNLFSIIGSTLDQTICRNILGNDENPFSSLRTNTNNLCRNETSSRYFIGDRATPGETSALLTRIAQTKSDKAQDLFRAINQGGEALPDIVNSLFESPDNLNFEIPRNPPSYDKTVQKVGQDMFKPVITSFYSELTKHVPSLMNVKGDGRVFADDYRIRSIKELQRGLNSQNSEDLRRYYRSYVNMRLGGDNKGYRKRPSFLEGYDVTEDLLKTRVTPLVTDLVEFSPPGFSYDRFNFVYGLRPARNENEDQWANTSDQYTVRLLDTTEPHLNDDRDQSSPINETVFAAVFDSQKLHPDVASYLTTVGDGQPSPTEVPGSVDAFFDIIMGGWKRALSTYDPGFEQFLMGQDSKDLHYRHVFSDTNKASLEYFVKLSGIGKMFQGSLFDERLKNITCALNIHQADPPDQAESGILNIDPIAQSVVDFEAASTEEDRAKRSVMALCQASYRLYLRTVAIKIVLESMFVFAKFRPKVIFSSKLFIVYFVKYLLREVKSIDSVFLGQMIDYFRNEMITQGSLTSQGPSEAETAGQEFYDSGFLRIDPLTGEQVKVITEYYISGIEQTAGASQGHPGEHGYADPDRIIDALLRGLEDEVEDGEREPADEDEVPPCITRGAIIGAGLVGNGEVDEATGLEIIGFLEYFIKEQLAQIIPDIELAFENFERFTSNDIMSFVTSEIPLIKQFDVVPYEATLSGGTSQKRVYSDVLANQFLPRGTGVDIQGQVQVALDSVDEEENTLEAVLLNNILRSFDEEESYPGEFAENRREKIEKYIDYIFKVINGEDSLIQPQMNQYKNGGFVIERYVRNTDSQRGIYQGGIASFAEHQSDLSGRIEPYLNSNTGLVDISHLKFGVRLCYVYPLKLNKEFSVGLEDLRTNIRLEAGEETDAYENFGSSTNMFENPDVRNRMRQERAYILTENIGVNNQNNTQITVRARVQNTPVYEYQEDLEQFTSDLRRQFKYFMVPVASQELNISGQFEAGQVQAEGFLETLYGQEYQSRMSTDLLNSAPTKAIFEYCFPLERFLSLATIYNAEYVRGMSGRERYLRQTQEEIIKLCQIAENLQRDDWWEKTPADFGFKEEQLGVSKEQMPLMAALKVIEGLISIVPPLKAWFKGLFQLIPKTLDITIDLVPGLETALGLLPFDPTRLIRSAANTKNKALPKMPPYKDSPRDVLTGENSGSCVEEEDV
jgi:hypothetical protein